MRRKSWNSPFLILVSIFFSVFISMFFSGSASFAHAALLQRSDSHDSRLASVMNLRTESRAEDPYIDQINDDYNGQERAQVYQLTAGLRPGRGEPIPAAQDVHVLPVQDISFYNLRGYLLSGWIAINSPDAPVIILTHGTPGNRVSMISRAAFLFQHGYNVLLFDFQSYGKSQGVMSTLGMVESEDILAAISYVKSRDDTAHSKVGVLGLSMGATAAVLAAARSNDIDALVAESCPEDATRVLSDVPNEATRDADQALASQIYGVDITQARPIAVVNTLANHTALFFINGDADHTTPLAGMYQLYQAAGGSKQYWVVPGAGHAQSFDVDPIDFEARVDTFFDASLNFIP